MPCDMIVGEELLKFKCGVRAALEAKIKGEKGLRGLAMEFSLVVVDVMVVYFVLALAAARAGAQPQQKALSYNPSQVN